MTEGSCALKVNANASVKFKDPEAQGMLFHTSLCWEYAEDMK